MYKVHTGYHRQYIHFCFNFNLTLFSIGPNVGVIGMTNVEITLYSYIKSNMPIEL